VPDGACTDQRGNPSGCEDGGFMKRTDRARGSRWRNPSTSQINAEIGVREPDPPRSSALAKAIAVLEVLASTHRPMSAAEIGLELGQNRQTTHRVLAQLEELELIARDMQPERFRLGSRFGRLAIAGLSSMASRQQVRATLVELVDEVRETCNIGVLDGNEVVYVDRVECDWPLRVQLQAGSRVPAYCTAIGKLLLAHMEPARLQHYLSTVDLEPLNQNTIVDPEQLSAHLGDIRRDGYSINDQEDSVGLLAVAVPLRDTDGHVLGGLALHGPEARLPRERAVSLVPRMLLAAKRLSAEFASASLTNGDLLSA